MWAVRILTGPQAGQTFPLKQGRNLLGRAPNCDIRIQSAGVSKEHSEVQVFPDRVVISDLQSSNGTFVNGVKIQNSIVRMGDKVGVHDVIIDIVPAAPSQRESPRPRVMAPPAVAPGSVPMAMPGTIPQYHNVPGSIPPQGGASGGPGVYVPPQPPLQALMGKIQDYMDRVALPAIYKLAELFEFRIVLLGFIGVFILATTLLSMIPMVTITREAITLESKRRAQSLSRSLADLNQMAYLRQEYTSLAVDSVEVQEGVEQAIIVEQSSGNIIAPASRAGATADIAFIDKIRSEGRGFVGQQGSKIISSFPMGAYDATSGEQTIRAHAIVIYDMSALEFDDGRALSLFLQTLVIACFAGLIIFYFMYSLIEHPIRRLNAELDIALREKKDTTAVAFQFPALQALIGNINSLLSRYTHGEGSNAGGGGFINRDGEMENLVQLLGLPGVVINRDGRIVAANSGFAQIARSDIQALVGHMVSGVPDVALQQNLSDLMRRALEDSRQVHTDQLEFSGHPCLMSCQALTQGSAGVEFFVITIAPIEGG